MLWADIQLILGYKSIGTPVANVMSLNQLEREIDPTCQLCPKKVQQNQIYCYECGTMVFFANARIM
jgi:hypothetical protein